GNDAADHDRSRRDAVAAHAGRDERHGRGWGARGARGGRERRRRRAGGRRCRRRRRRRLPAHRTEGLRAPPDRPALTPGQEAHGVDCQEFLRPLWRANQARGGTPMPKIRHIALSTQDVEKTAKFYVETFGMKEVGKVDDPGTRGSSSPTATSTSPSSISRTIRRPAAS